MVSRRKRLLMIFMLLAFNVTAQELNHTQAWFDVSASVKLGERFSFTPELGYRSEPEIDLRQIYFRTYFSYRPHQHLKLSVWAAQYNSRRPGNQQTIELRASQFISIFWPRIGGFKFEHRLGLDQRMFYEPGYELRKYVHRSRVRIGLHSPVFAVLGSTKSFYANGSFEVLRNVNQKEIIQWIDHDWITATLGYKISEAMKIEANLLLINLLDPITHDFEREITAYRLRFKYNFL